MTEKKNSADGTKASRFQRHLAALDLDEAAKRAVTAPELFAERELIAASEPKTLSFPAGDVARIQAPKRHSKPAPKYFAWVSFGAALAAAAITLVVVNSRDDSRGDGSSGWIAKGGASAEVFVSEAVPGSGTGSENLAARPWQEGEVLAAGARVKANVVAGAAPAQAFWGVVGREQKMLSSPQWILQSRLVLKPREKANFDGSLELDAKNEGETLVVVICPEANLAILTPDATVARIEDLMTGGGIGEDMAGCWSRRYPLRP